MSNYTPATNFGAKDALASGNAAKAVLGAELATEFTAIATMSATKEDTANKNVNSGYAGLDSGGRVAKAQLPVAVAYEDEANVFLAQLEIEHTTPRLLFDETDGGANQRLWDIAVGTAGIVFRTRTDADGSGADFFTAVRSGTTVASLALAASTITLNGVASSAFLQTANLLTAIQAIDGPGSGIDADLLDNQTSAYYQNASNLTAGTIPDARIQASGVTQHQASLAINADQLVTTVSTSASTAYTVAAADQEDVVRLTESASAVTVTVNTTHGFANGDSATYMRDTAQTVTFAASGTTIRSPGSRLSIPEQNGLVTLTCIGTNEFALSGV